MDFDRLSSLAVKNEPMTARSALHGIGYGLYIVTTRQNGKDSGLIINSVCQVASSPDVITLSIQRGNASAAILAETKKCNLHVLDQTTPFSLIERFGFHSGRDTDKMKGLIYGRSENLVPYLTEHIGARFSLEVIETVTLPSHLLFFCHIGESEVLTKNERMSYAYYHSSVKPRPSKAEGQKKGFVCRVCGYVYEGDSLPEDFICPICKHGVSDFDAL